MYANSETFTALFFSSRKPYFFGEQLISVLQAESHIAYLMQHRILPKTEAFWRKSGALYFFLYGLHLNWPFSCFSYDSLNYLMQPIYSDVWATLCAASLNCYSSRPDQRGKYTKYLNRTSFQILQYPVND